MQPKKMDDTTLAQIQKLIEANFAGRDELYAAAASVDDESREDICRRLAEHLAANAIELQQIVEANGVDPQGPLDTDAIARALFDVVKSNRGEAGVLRAAAHGEDFLAQDYDQAIESTADQEAQAILRKQREEVEFGKQVLRNIAASDENDSDA